MIDLRRARTVHDLLPSVEHLFALSAAKIRLVEQEWRPENGTPVFTVEGRYQARGWTEWTEGFLVGSALLQFDATGEAAFLDLGRDKTVARMATHLTHAGVHDHGFNNVSTYGTLWRLAREGRIAASEWERRFYELGLKVSGAVQAMRWTRIPAGGFIHSFNGAQSLFVDTMRSLRALALAHALGQALLTEQDERVSLLDRLLQHARATARYNVYYGLGRDVYDVRGRVAHESLFNPVNGSYRGPSSQQGYSPFTTWTRGLAWAVLGYAEQLEFLATLSGDDLAPYGGRKDVERWMLEAALATADYYIEIAAADGVPYWDSGAPGLQQMGDWGAQAADPFNDYEPVDSSAAVIAAQGLLRLARYLGPAHSPAGTRPLSRPERALHGRQSEGGPNPNGRSESAHAGYRYEQAGLTVLATLFDPEGPYLSAAPSHQGLLLHSVYHRPNAWDHVPEGSRIPRGESSQWGDYHAREAALYLLRLAKGDPYLTFFGPATN